MDKIIISSMLLAYAVSFSVLPAYDIAATAAGGRRGGMAGRQQQQLP